MTDMGKRGEKMKRPIIPLVYKEGFLDLTNIPNYYIGCSFSMMGLTFSYTVLSCIPQQGDTENILLDKLEGFMEELSVKAKTPYTKDIHDTVLLMLTGCGSAEKGWKIVKKFSLISQWNRDCIIKENQRDKKIKMLKDARMIEDPYDRMMRKRVK